MAAQNNTVKRLTICFLFAFVPLFTALATAQPRVEATPELRQKTFEKIWQTINDKFWDPAFGGHDWKAIRAAYLPQVKTVRTDKEFYDLMDKMLGLLKTSHMGVIRPDTIAKYRQVPAITGIGFREIEGQVVITHVIDNSSAAEAGLKPGFVVTKIDGDAINKFSDAEKKIEGLPNTSLKLSYLDEKDQAHDVVLERRPFSDENKSHLIGFDFYALFESKRLAGNVGYIYFSNFLAFLKPRITAAVESMHDAPGIIIDLRGNSGGDDSVGIAMASLLFEKETKLMRIRTRKGETEDYKAKGAKDAFTGKVVILLDAQSRSASEEFSAGMQESGRAIVIGQTSAGADMDGDLEKLPDGSILFYAHGQPSTPKGRIIDGNGVKPDIEVALTRAGLLTGHDAQIDAAIQYILAKK